MHHPEFAFRASSYRKTKTSKFTTHLIYRCVYYEKFPEEKVKYKDCYVYCDLPQMRSDLSVLSSVSKMNLLTS